MRGRATVAAASRSALLQQQRAPVWDEELWANRERVVYGPVASRRLGNSLGVNLFPGAKVCSFNCCYCDLGPTPADSLRRALLPGGRLSATVLQEGIERGVCACLDSGTRIDHVTVCGNGEAADHPEFAGIVRFLDRFRNAAFPEIPLAILTNSVALGNPDVAEAIEHFDVKFLKLDAGDEHTFLRVAQPLPGLPSFEEIVEGLKRFNGFFLQTAVVDSPTVSNLASLRGPFVDLLAEIRPRVVYLHNIDYPTPDASIRRLSLEELTDIGDSLAARSGISVRVLHSLVDLRRRPSLEAASTAS